MKLLLSLLPPAALFLSYYFGLVTEEEISRLTGEEVLSEIIYSIYVTLTISSAAFSAIAVIIYLRIKVTNLLQRLNKRWSYELRRAAAEEIKERYDCLDTDCSPWGIQPYLGDRTSPDFGKKWIYPEYTPLKDTPVTKVIWKKNYTEIL